MLTHEGRDLVVPFGVDEVRPLILARTPVDVDRLADPGTPYADLLG